MSSAVVTPPSTTTTRLVVDTDVASYIFKWHPTFAPQYVEVLRVSELILSFMSVAEMRGGALNANWGPRRCELLEAYLANFSILQSDNDLCTAWAKVWSESKRKGRPIGSADAWIAATALVLSVPLVTNNPKDYRHLDKLQIISLTQAE